MVFDNLGPCWTHLDTFGPFQTKINLLPKKDNVGFGGGAVEQKIIFRLKWSRRLQTGPDGSQMVKIIYFGPFWTPLDHFEMLTSLPCLAALFVLLVPFLGHPVVHIYKIHLQKKKEEEKNTDNKKCY